MILCRQVESDQESHNIDRYLAIFLFKEGTLI